MVPSDFFRKVAVKQLSIEESKIKVWGSSGVDLAAFRPSPLEFQRPQGIIQLLYVSRLDPNKGWSILLQSMKDLNQEFPGKFRLSIAGHGSQEEVSKLGKLISEFGIEEYCEYVGAKNQSELPELLQRADLFIFPTLYPESLGLVAIEAMACGIPVIGTRIGALPEYIEEGRTGFLFESGNHSELTAVIKKFARGMPEIIEEMRQYCINTASKYDRVKLEDEMEKWLSMLISR